MPSDNSQVVDVQATVEVSDTSRPPRITFSFPGLLDPMALWAELETLGWHVPDRPHQPEPEIDWNSPGSSEYHVLPYRVTGFKISPKKWQANQVAKRGLKTINTLRRFGVDLQIPIAYLDFLRRTQMSLIQGAPTSNEAPVERPTRVPNTLLLSRQPWAVLVEERSAETFETAVGPNQKTWFWTESARQVGEVGSSVNARKALIGSVDMGWELLSRVEGPPALDGRDRVLRFIVQDVRDGSDMLRRLKGSIGDRCASMLMRPIRQTGAVDNCLFIVAVVPSERFAEIGYQMISEFPDAIGRGKRHAVDTGESAA
jgi:hypothetical protein